MDNPEYEYNGKTYTSKTELYGAILADQSMEQFGINDLLALGAMGSGANVIPTRGKFGGSTPNTSLASKLSRKIPGSLPFKVKTPTGFPYIGKGLRFMPVSRIGVIVGRYISVVGWGILTYDAASILYNTQTIYNNIVNGK